MRFGRTEPSCAGTTLPSCLGTTPSRLRRVPSATTKMTSQGPPRRAHTQETARPKRSRRVQEMTAGERCLGAKQLYLQYSTWSHAAKAPPDGHIPRRRHDPRGRAESKGVQGAATVSRKTTSLVELRKFQGKRLLLLLPPLFNNWHREMPGCPPVSPRDPG